MASKERPVHFSWLTAVRDSDLTSTTKLLLFTLATHMNSDGEGCFPSVATLAKETSTTERTVCTHIETAEEAGFITVKMHGFSGQGWRRNEYILTWPEGTEPISRHHQKALNVAQEGTEPNDGVVLNVVQSSTSGSTSMSTSSPGAQEEKSNIYPEMDTEHALIRIWGENPNSSRYVFTEPQDFKTKKKDKQWWVKFESLESEFGVEVCRQDASEYLSFSRPPKVYQMLKFIQDRHPSSNGHRSKIQSRLTPEVQREKEKALLSD